MSAPNRPTTSLWLATSPKTEYPGLDGDQTADVAILGGGIVGLSAAFLLSRAGVNVTVLESGLVGAGVTGHSTAKVSSLHGLTYAGLRSTFGEDVARVYGDANQAGLEQVASLVEELRIDCDFDRRPNYTYSESSAERDQIEEEVETAASLGLPAVYTEETDLPFAVAAGVRFDDQAQFHPSKYLAGLAGATHNQGVQIYERTRAVGVDAGSPCHVKTEGGHVVSAERVIVATGFPILDRGLYFARLHTEREYVLAVRVSGTPPQGMYLSTEQPSHSIRSHPLDADHQLLIVAGESHKTGQADSAERYSRLEAWVRARWDVVAVERRWSTQDNMPADGLPYIGRLSPRSDRIYTATGFKKWGLAKGTAAAMILSDLVLGRSSAWATTFDPGRLNARASAASLLKENANVAARFVGDRITKREAAADLRPDEGRVVRAGSRQIAAYRDEDGDLHEVSARCTHMGCIVAFNDAERTWDCPCHGSRFSVDGRVLQGPATADLEQIAERAQRSP